MTGEKIETTKSVETHDSGKSTPNGLQVEYMSDQASKRPFTPGSSQDEVQASLVHTLMKDNGRVFDEIAGEDHTITQAKLIKAAEDPQSHLTTDERLAAKYMADNWNDATVNQMKDGRWSAKDYAKTGAAFLPVISFVDMVEIGWDAGRGTAGIVGGVVGAIGGGVANEIPFAAPVVEGLYRNRQAGSVTKDTLSDLKHNT